MNGFLFSIKDFVDIIEPLSLKKVLAEQAGVLQDILWDAGIDPRFDMREASETDFMALYTSVKKILKEMCEQGGRDTEKDLFGQKGNYITQLSKNTLFEPCIKCGHAIQKVNFLGGTVYYCENCQKS